MRWIVLALIALVTGTAAAETVASAKITYVTTSTVYVDAGSGVGLQKGASLRVVRDGIVIATLEAAFVSSSRTSCPMPDGTSLRVGDTVTFSTGLPASTPAADRPTPVADAPRATPSQSLARGLRDAGWRGVIGARYLGLRNHGDYGGHYGEPALDVRATGSDILRDDLDVTVDIRARRTFRTSADGSSESLDRSRVVLLNGEWNPPASPWRVTFGRQYGVALAAVSSFDGLSVQRAGPTWTLGTWIGRSPGEQESMTSTRTTLPGFWVARHQGPNSRFRWSGGLAMSGAYRDGEVDREFMALHGRWSNGRLSATALQQIDVNRGWKSDQERIVSPTSTLLRTNYQWTRSVSVGAGWDTRRRIRLLRNRSTPETEFDDRHRRGAWITGSWRPGRPLYTTLTLRRSSRAGRTSARSATSLVRLNIPSLSWVSLSARGTQFDNGVTKGWLRSVSSRIVTTKRTEVEFSLGRRTDRGDGASESRTQRWVRADTELRIRSEWWLLLSLERDSGDIEKSTQIHATASWRF